MNTRVSQDSKLERAGKTCHIVSFIQYFTYTIGRLSRKSSASACFSVCRNNWMRSFASSSMTGVYRISLTIYRI